MHRGTTLSRPTMGAETASGSVREVRDSSEDSHSGTTLTRPRVGAKASAKIESSEATSLS